ncbi:MAG: UDP-N-acetylmuramoyl-tripeptide--D-alanyl-D-alanine ligase [Treponema sp.]|nr:UDP-N-acetylmuramoyl-tripeptide--D-alanyl-D-alanine ligase [Treponema sp.]
MDTNLMGIGELSGTIGGRHISFTSNCGFSSVAIDSRCVNEGALFFALAGSSLDGHGFVEDAFKKGAKAAVVSLLGHEKFNLSDIARKMEKDLIIVNDTLKALQDSARAYIERFKNIIKVGITGSSGKTTTKEIAAAIISCDKNTVMNKGNFNSETGLPLSVFEVRDCHEVGIFELGMNRPGEISEIAEVLKPNIALVTNIGSAHIEYFGSKAKIVDEKKCIFNFLNDDDIALIPQNDEFKNELSQGVKGKIKYYDAGFFSELEGTRSLGLEGTEILWDGEKIHFALPGKHSLEDAMAAIAIAKEIPVKKSAIKQGLESVKPLFGRLEILKGRTTVVRDCYNANPQSCEKAIEFCDSVDWPARKIYVIADMLELGEASFCEHKNIGSILASSKADKVFLFGNEIKAAADCMTDNKKDYFYTDKIDVLYSQLNCYAKEGDLVLLKGSRGCALERLSGMLTGTDEENAGFTGVN